MPPATNKRNSAIELLRMFAMFIIICSHYINFGAQINSDSTLNQIVSALFYTGNIGTDIFIVLSGYLMINSKFSFKKVFTLAFQVVFYSVCIYTICCACSIQTFSFGDAVSAFFPASFELYWFFSTYLIMYILSPFINKFLNSVTRATHLVLVLTTGLLWSVLPTLTNKYFGCNVLIVFIMLYIIGAYLRKYPDNILSKNKNDAIAVVLCTIIIAMSAIVVLLFVPSLSERPNFFYTKNSVFVVIISAGLVSFVSKIKPFYSKFINTVASTVFGVYLIHNNKFSEGFMWNEIFNIKAFASSNLMIVHMLVCAAIIFAVCGVTELLRKALIEKPVLTMYDKIYEKAAPKLLTLKEKIIK